MRITRFPSRADGAADRMAGFVAHLRMNGLKVGPGETGAALAALAETDAVDPESARAALRIALAPDAEAWRRFDDLFDAYWFNAGRKPRGETRAHSRLQSTRPALWHRHFDDASNEGAESGGEDRAPDDGDGEAEGVDGRLTATRTDNLARRDLRELMDEESLLAAEAAARRLAQAIRDRRSRRRKRANRGSRLDLRRIQRASLARGGEPLDIYRKARPERPTKIVALCDVSGSMTVYARVFLAFLKGLLDADTRADAYLFHTRLMRIADALRDRDALRAAARLSLMAEGFGGGTDIGRALEAFNDGHAARALNSRTVAIVLSDGYCSGSPERLAEGLSRIRRKARRVIWMNPLKGWRGYAPVAAGIEAALPHLDAHLAANTIEALASLESQFAKL